MFEIIIQNREAFLQGLSVTLQLSSITWVIGIVIGSALGLASARWRRSVGAVTQSISFFLSGVPILVFLYWLHYPAQNLLGIVVDPFWTAAFVLATVNLFAVEHLVRNAAQSLPSEFRQAGRVCGLSSKTITLKIELPLLMRQLVGPILLSQVIALHMTLFASLISVDELLRMAQRVNSKVYQPIEIYSALGLFFLIVSLPVNGVALVLKRKFGRDLSER